MYLGGLGRKYRNIWKYPQFIYDTISIRKVTSRNAEIIVKEEEGGRSITDFFKPYGVGKVEVTLSWEFAHF